jgi:hypothetical protein
MSLTLQSSARNAVGIYQVGRARMCIQRCSSGGRELLHQLTSALMPMFVRCQRGWRHLEYRPSSGFTEASVSVVTILTIRGSAFGAPRLTPCGARPRLSRYRQLPAMLATAICSAPSVLMFGRRSRAVGFISVLGVADSQDRRRETVQPNKSLQPTRGGALVPHSRFTAFEPGWLSSSR